MSIYTIECAVGEYHGIRLCVEADSYDDALKTAVAKACNEGESMWFNDNGPIFVRAAVEGKDVDPWDGVLSKRAIPSRFTEQRTTPIVTVRVERGIVQNVIVENGAAHVVVHDYDMNKTDRVERLPGQDETGRQYLVTDWS